MTREEYEEQKLRLEDDTERGWGPFAALAALDAVWTVLRVAHPRRTPSYDLGHSGRRAPPNQALAVSRRCLLRRAQGGEGGTLALLHGPQLMPINF